MNSNQPPLEQDKNELNSLDTESDTEQEPITIGTAKPGEDISFREAIKFQSDNFSCELYSSSVNVTELCNILLWIKDNVSNNKKTKESYTG